jgi:hypothetical protein
MALIDVKPLGDIEKYLQLAVVCCVSFFGTFGSVMGAMLANGSSIALSAATGFSSACLLMSAALLATAKRSKLFTKITPDLPKGLESIVEGTDLHKPGASADDLKRRFTQ